MILLLMMVLVSSVLVVLAGGALVNDLQSRAQAAQADETATVVDQQLSQVIASDTAYSLSAVDTASQEPVVRENGTATVAWVDANDTTLPRPSSACRVDVAPLGAIEYRHSQGIVAYQSGGVWRQSGAGSTVSSKPDISYDGERLQLGFVQVTAADETNGSAVASVNASTTRRLTTALERASRCGSSRTVVIEIRSQYHAGWYSHLNRSLRGGEQAVTVEHNASAGLVTARIENVRSTQDGPDIQAVGPTTLAGANSDGRVEYGTEPITIETTLAATHSPVTNQQLTITIGGESGLTTTTNVTVRRDEARSVTITVPPAAYTSVLDPGQQYGYDLLAGNTPLATGGSVYVGAPDPTFSLSTPTTSLESDSLTIAAQLTNEGVTTDTASVSLRLRSEDGDPAEQYDIDPVTVSRAAGATGRVSWRISTDRLTAGTHTYRIETDDDVVSGRLTVPAPDVETTGSELAFDRTRAVNVTVLGPEVSTEQRTSYEDSGIVGGNYSAGQWQRTGAGTATLDWPGRTVPAGPSVEPSYDESGGWRPVDGRLQCLRPGDAGCGLYGFPNTTAFEWDEEGGYELDWTATATGNWSWEGPGTFDTYDVYQKYWWPVTLDIGIERDDGTETTHRSPWRPANASGGESLNRFDKRDRVHRHSMEVEAGTRLSFEATTWNCANGSSWNRAGRDTYAGSSVNRTDRAAGAHAGPPNWRGVWYHYDCSALGEPLLRVDSRTATNPEHVRSRDAVRDRIPELRAGAPRQQSADELLGDRFVERYDNGTGVLDLEEDEFVFLFEITDDSPGNASADEYFRRARATQTPGDPNFNDLIVLVELGDDPESRVGTHGGLRPAFDSAAGEPVTSIPGSDTTDDDPEAAGEGRVDVDVDGNAIVIR